MKNKITEILDKFDTTKDILVYRKPQAQKLQRLVAFVKETKNTITIKIQSTALIN